ncbi:MAG: phosphoglycerate dehydrogenase-like enzyme [Gammaproteobacteria bacterium]|jgi:phosphoglycerate dehydrogenase-like enzyme
MSDRINVLIHGAADVSEIPGLDQLSDLATFECAQSVDELRVGLAHAQVLLGWDFRAAELAEVWSSARQLRWIHWGGAGVDALLFAELVASDVVVTNARGIFDVAMAEYTLGLALAMAKDFVRTFADQQNQHWNYRTTQSLQGKQALVVGVGSIGRAIARTLRAFGMHVVVVGRQARNDDAEFAAVHGIDELDELLVSADYVVLITPLTQHTRGLFNGARFARMHRGARFINLGRGALIDEDALADALQRGSLAGAALDVFQHEPLPADSALWSTPNLIVSPHMSGDVHDYRDAVAAQFVDNLQRYCAGERLRNVVDKELGFVRE